MEKEYLGRKANSSTTKHSFGSGLFGKNDKKIVKKFLIKKKKKWWTSRNNQKRSEMVKSPKRIF